ncbi:putative MFS multidrug transporter [Saitoella complicata NRRL Y-17804]|uniref:putative MFS multidrug transporter n=1 Tax=Saitoella complicata (strain BCRC 22490 / CBS 7301 / JCM 7358 / NBRC 10748 / NRRL Y-17804) TaxID=698492 RepID=UPI00086793DB|nr:putative MFS multidrug transporter [Saitoella complicata NRRL Y-17804]ODQ53228.1 putative MFS multidrug transporter [Saitoella complicata NRRL Y-17804]
MQRNADEAAERSPLLRQTVSPSEAETDHGSATVREPTKKDLALIMPALYIGTFLASLDGTIIAAILPKIGSEFQSFNIISFVATAYLVSTAAFQPLCGKLSDIFGRRECLVFAEVVFGIGCLGCGLSRNVGELVAARAIAGVGGGWLTALSTIISSDLIPARDRGMWQGIANIVFGVGAASGAPLGGFLADRMNWRWSFLIQVPLTVIGAIIVFFNVKGIPKKEHEHSALKRIDFMGAVTMVTSLCLLLFGLNTGGNQLEWTDPILLTILPLSGLLMILFGVIEAKWAMEPVIPMNLLKQRTILAGSLANWFACMSIFSLMYQVPLYFIAVKGYTATQAGLRLIPQSIMLSVGSLGCGIYMKKTGKYWWPCVIGFLSMVLGAAGISTFDRITPLWEHILFTAFPGFGYGIVLTTTLLALISSVGHEWQATTTGISYAFRATGSTIGVAATSSIFNQLLRKFLEARIDGSHGNIIQAVRESVGAIRTIPIEFRDVVITSYLDALRRHT